MKTLGLRDVAFLASTQPTGVPPPIDTSDANTHAWWKADTHVIENTTVGDKMDTTVDKTSYVAPNFNLRVYPTILSYQGLCEARGDNDANLLYQSESISDSYTTASNCTKDTATTCTFTGTGGYVRKVGQLTDCTDSFTFKIYARAVSGNTNLQLLHVGAGGGDKTPVTLTGSLAWYTATFTGSASGEILVGLQDDNGGGFGQVEIQKWQLYRSDHDGNYLACNPTPRLGPRGGVNVWASGMTNWGSYLAAAVARTNSGPCTVYMSVYLRNPWQNWAFVNSTPSIWNQIIAVGASNHVACYQNATWGTASSPNDWTLGTWQIITVVFNGASSYARVNKNVASAITLGANVPMNAPQIGGESYSGTRFGGEFHEVITRYTADDAATQDTFIDYMAGQIGLSV